MIGDSASHQCANVACTPFALCYTCMQPRTYKLCVYMCTYSQAEALASDSHLQVRSSAHAGTRKSHVHVCLLMREQHCRLCVALGDISIIPSHCDYCLHDCKVTLATLCTELTRVQDGGYTAVDPTSP